LAERERSEDSVNSGLVRSTEHTRSDGGVGSSSWHEKCRGVAPRLAECARI